MRAFHDVKVLLGNVDEWCPVLDNPDHRGALSLSAEVNSSTHYKQPTDYMLK